MNRIGHVEIAGTNGGQLASFYERLFEWKIERRDISGFDYYDIATAVDGGAVVTSPTAGIRHEPDGKAEIVIYVEVDDVAEAVAKARTLGATVRIEPVTYGDLTFALIEDPEGNPVGLTRKDGDVG